MNDYKLYIKDLSNVWRLADLGDSKPAMNYQSNDINELKDRKANYSQELQLPFTPVNCAVFGYVNDDDIISNVPYTKLECRLFCGDALISGKGSYLILNSFSKKYFSVQILSGTANLFLQLKSKPVSDLDLGSYKLGSESFVYDDYDYAIAKSNFISSENNWNNSDLQKALPHAWLVNIVSRIMGDSGYTYETNIPDWNRYTISCCSKIPDENSFVPFHCSATGDTPTSFSNPVYLGWYDILNDGEQTLSVEPIGGISGNNYAKLVWKPKVNGTGKINLSINFLYAATEIDILIESQSNTILEQTVISATSGQIYNFNETIDIANTDEIIITILDKTTSVGAKITASFNIDEIESDFIPLGGILPISKNLGFNTQLDLLKAFVQLFGLTVLVDNDSKKVYFYTFKKLYDNKANAIDWSDKLDISDEEITFKTGDYAKKNYIDFEKYEDEFVSIHDVYSFDVDDEKLDYERNLFTIPFESGMNYKELTVDTIDVALIPLYTKKIDENTEEVTYEFKGGKPHICEVIRLYDGGDHILNFAKNIMVQHFIDNYYTNLVYMLNKSKTITVNFLLTPEDIENFNQFVPIYISKYGRYFYVNKIKNFVKGKLTKCELVKL